ncbi:hypothetical protein IAE40_04650 [Pseudomonas sp. S44]|uniref:RHS repeat-associated core domain-containing protein n=1 Tax=Pseudomonas sp. S44 TaxID=2767450 RepID=UPI00190A63E3|nr:RHS repeat-associated core domain-containing protein [Pseudomonas sp. S44]MBK0057911.1 hypothetical protein [Pseudomonas sp. S44]
MLELLYSNALPPHGRHASSAYLLKMLVADAETSLLDEVTPPQEDMNMSTSTHGGKVNFHSYIESGVDPRTLTFSANILLGTLVNPNYDIRLFYSPLNQNDFGLGLGWRIPATVYNKKSKLLSLSDGRLYQVDENLNLTDSNGDVFLKEEPGVGYRVTYRSTGIIEFLTAGKIDLCPCTSRYSAFGVGMTLDWEIDEAANSVKLKSIHSLHTDKEQLLQIDYAAKAPVIKLWPDQDEQRTFALELKSNHLLGIENSSVQPPLNWKFDYERKKKMLSYKPGVYPLSRIRSPSGRVEKAFYNFRARVQAQATEDDFTLFLQAHTDSNTSYTIILRYVDQHFIERTGLEYDTKGALLSRSESSIPKKTFDDILNNPTEDSLEYIECVLLSTSRDRLIGQNTIHTDLSTSYSSKCGTREDFKKKQSQLKERTKTVNYTYNELFSITKETSLINNATQLTKTWKYDSHGRLIEAIENQEKKTLSYLLDNAESNLIAYEKTIPDTAEKSTYLERFYFYTAHKQTTTPLKGQITYLPEALITNRYQSEKLKHQTIDHIESYHTDANNSEYLQVDEMSSYESHSEIIERQALQTCLNKAKWPADVNSDNTNLTEKLKISYIHSIAGQTERIATLTTRDDLTCTTSSTVSTRTGLVLKEQDISGNISSYTWDGLGRLTKTLNNSGSEFETTETYEHGLALPDTLKFKDDKAPSLALSGYIQHTDTTGAKTLSIYDNRNQEIEVWECRSDPENEWYCLQKKSYVDGKVREVIDYDYSSSTPVHRTALTQYLDNTRFDIEKDSSGDASTTAYIYTVAWDTAEYRAIVKVYFDNTAVESSAQAELGAGTMNGYIRFWINDDNVINKVKVPFDCVNSKPFGLCEMQFLDTRGNVTNVHRLALSVAAKDSRTLTVTPHSTASQTYNAGKRTSVTDEQGQLTSFAYDVFGRVTTTTYPDGSVLNKTYPTHSSRELIESITLTAGETVHALGTQVFDGLERLVSSTSTGQRTFTYTDNRLDPAKEVSPRGTLTYESIPQLGSAAKSIKGKDLHHQFSYAKGTGLLSQYTDQSGLDVTLGYGALSRPVNETIVPAKDQPALTQSLAWSPNGRCTSYKDVAGVTQARRYDARGNVVEVDDPDIKVTAVYGAFNRMKSQVITRKKSAEKLTIEYSYNALGEEVERRIVPADKSKAVTVQHTYRKNHQLATRTVIAKGQTVRKESFSYDNRNMLSGYECSGSELNLDSFGKAITKLELTNDALGNIVTCISHFDGGSDTATFHYDNPQVPCQLSKISHTHADYPAVIELKYDANGCMTKNEKGQTLSYDALNRLASLKDAEHTYLYHYDPQGRLRSRSKLTERTDWHYDPSMTMPLLVSERRGEKTLRLCRLAEEVCATTHPDTDKPLLICADRVGTPLITLDGTLDPKLIKCSPFGISDAPLSAAWTGGLYDDVSGVYHLGERQYSPSLMRFTTPDSWSPFGAGGYNIYAYLDPVNCPDPNGHISFWGWVGIAAAVLLGVVVGVLTMGAGVAAIMATGMTLAAGMMVAGGALILAAGVVGIAAEVVRDHDPATARTLDWVAFGLGVAGAVLTLGAGFARGAAQTALRGVRSAAPRVGRMSVYAVQDRTLAIELQPLGQTLEAGGRAMQAEFIGGSRFAYSTASDMVSGVQSVGSTLALDLLSRLASTAPFRLVGMTMGMEAMLGLGIGARHHHDQQA